LPSSSPHSYEPTGSQEPTRPLDLTTCWTVAIRVLTRQSDLRHRPSERSSGASAPPLSIRHACANLTPRRLSNVQSVSTKPASIYNRRRQAAVGLGLMPRPREALWSVHTWVPYRYGSKSLQISAASRNPLSVHLGEETQFDYKRLVSHSHVSGVRPSSPGEGGYTRMN